MRPLPAVLVALAVTALMLLPIGGSADVDDPGAPKYVNRMLGNFVTPTVAPGETLTFSFEVNNTYSESGSNMADILLTVGIYMYATKDEAREVNASFENPPLINGESTEYSETVPLLVYGENHTVSFEIETSKKTPHGTYFSQSTYFVRISLEFHFPGNATEIVMKSKGWFTDEQWTRLTTNETGASELNRTYLASLGVDGIIPDSSFGLKVPIPRWPLAVLGVACAGVAFMALYYFVLDNPGKYPRLEKRFYYLRGKLGEFWRQLKDRRRK